MANLVGQLVQLVSFFVSIRRSSSQDLPRTVESKGYLLRSTQCLRLLGPTSSSQNIRISVDVFIWQIWPCATLQSTGQFLKFFVSISLHKVIREETRISYIDIYISKYKLDRWYWHKQWQGRIRVVLQRQAQSFQLYTWVNDWHSNTRSRNLLSGSISLSHSKDFRSNWCFANETKSWEYIMIINLSPLSSGHHKTSRPNQHHPRGCVLHGQR